MHAQEEVAIASLVAVVGPAESLRIIGLTAALDGARFREVPTWLRGSVAKEAHIVHVAVTLRAVRIVATLDGTAPRPVSEKLLLDARLSTLAAIV